MRIFIPSSYFKPEQYSGAPLGNNRFQAFANENIQMLMYTPIPTRGVTADIRKEYKKYKRHELIYDNKMEVIRFFLMKEGKNPILRAIRYTLQCMKQFWFGAFSKEARACDIMFISSTPPIQGAMAALIKRFNRIPIVYNLQDIFPDSLVGTGLTKKNSILWKIGRKLEDFTYKHTDKIIVISEDFKKNIMAKGVPEEKIEVVYNWVDHNAVVPILKENNPLFMEFGINKDKFHVVYAGNLGNAQNIDIIIDSAKEMVGDKSVEFLIFGTGGLKDQFVKKVKTYGIDNVKFFPLQPLERVSQVYGLGDVCVVSCKPGLGGAAMPSKMLSIMSAGRPVVASFDEGELTYILKKYKCGEYALAGNVEAFVKIIRKMATDRNACEEMGRNARQLILERFTREYGTQRYVEIIKSVVDKN